MKQKRPFQIVFVYCVFVALHQSSRLTVGAPVQGTHHSLPYVAWQCHEPERNEWFVVPGRGLEPPRLAACAPQAHVFTKLHHPGLY